MSITTAIIKPDAMEKKIAGVVFSRIEAEGFEIVECLLMQITREGAARFYAEHAARSFYPSLCAFMASRPVFGMVLEREDAVAHWRRVLGATDSRVAFAEASRTPDGADPSPKPSWPLRALYGNQGIIWRNVAHGSDSDAAALREAAQLFPGGRLVAQADYPDRYSWGYSWAPR